MASQPFVHLYVEFHVLLSDLFGSIMIHLPGKRGSPDVWRQSPPLFMCKYLNFSLRISSGWTAFLNKWRSLELDKVYKCPYSDSLKETDKWGICRMWADWNSKVFQLKALWGDSAPQWHNNDRRFPHKVSTDKIQLVGGCRMHCCLQDIRSMMSVDKTSWKCQQKTFGSRTAGSSSTYKTRVFWLEDKFVCKWILTNLRPIINWEQLA